VGIGIWDRGDTASLAAMLDQTTNAPQTPHRLSRQIPKTKPQGIELINLADILPRTSAAAHYGTPRVIRIYQHTGARIELLERIDWELGVPEGGEWIRNDRAVTALARRLHGEGEFDAIVVKDMCKGVVSAALITLLRQRYPEARWYVSTKHFFPDWLKLLQGADVRLMMIPQIAAQDAIIKGEFGCWLTRPGERAGDVKSAASIEALYKLDTLCQEQWLNCEKVITVALPEASQVLARDRLRGTTESRLGMIQAEIEPRGLTVGVPMASVYFSALTSALIADENLDLPRLLKGAMTFTQEWMTFEVQRVEHPDHWSPEREPALTLPLDLPEGPEKWLDFPWDVARKQWDRALSGYGIIKDGPRSAIEVWRSTTEVDGYVCCLAAKRRVIRRLIRELRSFSDGSRREQKSCMLIARPGSGKTYLVRRIAKALGFRFLPFNITSMQARTDILDCFDTIVTTQAQSPDEPVLVFVDEINANLAGEPVYDAFLAPLEEGVYVRAGKAFHIEPCCWVFAGTQRPMVEPENIRDKSKKASDFESRLTLPPLPLDDDTGRDDNQARLENVYLGVSLLRSVFPDVRRVSTKVLRAFHLVSPAIPVRDLERFVRSFANIQYGEAWARNASTEWLRSHGVVVEDWERDHDERMVDIR
jgi:hypothetical protein